LGELHLLHRVAATVMAPPAVVAELDVGAKRGVPVPHVQSLPWIQVRAPLQHELSPLASRLGPGEIEVISLAREIGGAVALLDDRLARRVAQAVRVPVSGTLGVLLNAKEAGLIKMVGPYLSNLDKLGFRVAPSTRQAVLEMAGEIDQAR
jgi:hypothetical protein